MNSPHSRPLYIDKALPRAAPHRVAYAMCGVPDWFVAAVLAAVALAAALLATRRCGIPSPMGPWYSDMMMPVLRTGRFPGELGPWLVPPCLVPPCCAGCAPAAAYLCCRSRSPGALLRLPLPATTAVPADMVKLHAQHGPLFWWSFLGRRMLMVGTLEAVTRVHLGEGVIVRADYPTSVRKVSAQLQMPAFTQHCSIYPIMHVQSHCRAAAGTLGHAQHPWQSTHPHQVSLRPACCRLLT